MCCCVRVFYDINLYLTWHQKMLVCQSVQICLNTQPSSEPLLGLNLFIFFPHMESQSVRN